MQINMISNFKLQRSTSFVGVAFLTRLCSLQIDLDATHYLLAPDDEVGAKNCLLNRLNPVQQGSTTMLMMGETVKATRLLIKRGRFEFELNLMYKK
jgi:hypothetical protein